MTLPIQSLRASLCQTTEMVKRCVAQVEAFLDAQESGAHDARRYLLIGKDSGMDALAKLLAMQKNALSLMAQIDALEAAHTATAQQADESSAPLSDDDWEMIERSVRRWREGKSTVE